MIFRNKLNLGIALIGISIGLVTGILGEMSLKPFIVLMIALFLLGYFFVDFERSVLGLLVIRSALDIFSAQQLPAAYGIGIEFLAVLFVIVSLITANPIHTDKFWGFFVGWVVLQGVWLVLMLLGQLGFDSTYLLDSIREWIRLLLWPTIYLLVMQLRGQVAPSRIISSMFLSLPIPLIIASSQLLSGKLRVSSSFGHANAFATFLLLFICLSWWQLSHTQGHRWPWVVLLCILAFFLVSTKALFSLTMLSVCVLVVIIPKVNPSKLIGGLLLIIFVFGLFASSEFGRERLESVQKTPLGNSEITISRAILNSESDHNSFNWRLSQWHTVLKAWEQYPTFGYGLGLSKQSINSNLLPHNDYIRAMAEGGIVGLVAFLSFFAILCSYLFRLYQSASMHKPRQDLYLILLALTISTVIGMVTENIWSHTVFFFYLSALISVAEWDWPVDKVSSRPHYFSEEATKSLIH